MPNQRDKDKKFVGAWFKGKLYKGIKRAAAQRGISVSQWVTEHLTAAAGITPPVSSTATLADAIVSDAITAAAATPPVAPVSYRSRRKAARQKATPPAADSRKKAL